MSADIFLVAGEESGDRLGAALIAAIRKRAPAARFSGVGGMQMAGEGVSSLFPLGELAIIGFGAIITNLPKILRRIRETADAIVAARPDVLVIIDSPEFTHRVARHVRARAPGIRIVDYVCPSVWAWRPGRARAMTHYVDHVMALLPFEPMVLRDLGGPPCTYVGHPLMERLADLRPNVNEEATRRLGEPPRVLVLPGSRGKEIRRMAPIFGETLAFLTNQVGALEVVVPTVPRLAEMMRAAVSAWRVPARVVVEAADKNRAFRTARVALTKSGTSTLELALAGVPMVTAYKVSLVEEMVGRALIKIKTVILANVVLGEMLIPEFLQAACTPRRLAAALVPLFRDGPERQRQVGAFGRLDAIMDIGKVSASDRAATVVLDCIGRVNQPARETVASAMPRA